MQTLPDVFCYEPAKMRQDEAAPFDAISNCPYTLCTTRCYVLETQRPLL